jgi:hypothetical protein
MRRPWEEHLKSPQPRVLPSHNPFLLTHKYTHHTTAMPVTVTFGDYIEEVPDWMDESEE